MPGEVLSAAVGNPCRVLAHTCPLGQPAIWIENVRLGKEPPIVKRGADGAYRLHPTRDGDPFELAVRFGPREERHRNDGSCSAHFPGDSLEVG